MTATKQHWEQVYASKSPLEVSWYQTAPTSSLRLIHNCKLNKDQPIIDVGGGASVLVDHLAEQGYTRLVVLDISARSLAFARERLGGKANEVEWLEADVTEFELSHTVRLWHDRAVFHFLTEPSERIKYVERLEKTLQPGGWLILAAFAIGGPVKCSGLDIVQYDADKLCSELGAAFELIEELGETHATPSGTKQLFSYFRLLKK